MNSTEKFTNRIKIEKKFKNYLQNEGFDIYEIDADGNCLFRSIAHQLGSEDKYADIRLEAVKCIREKRERFEDFVIADFNGTFENYLAFMSEEGRWGGHLELTALSAALRVVFCLFKETQEIIVINHVDPNDNSGENLTEVKTLYLAFYQKKSHYFSLIPRTGNPEKKTSREYEIKLRKKISITKESKNQLKKNRDVDFKKFFNLNEDMPKKKYVFAKTKEEKKLDTIQQQIRGVNFKNIFVYNEEELLKWCVDIGFLKMPSWCKLCRKSGIYNKWRLSKNPNYTDGYCWRCQDHDCGEIRNPRENNILLKTFNKVKLRIMLIFIFTHFSYNVSPVISKRTLGLSFKRIREIGTLLGNLISKEQIKEENSCEKFGGPHRIIEMDESCFIRRKNNQGRLLNQVWAFGFVERDSGRLFAQIVAQRDTKTLIPIVQQHIRTDTKFVITDEWRSYKKLGKLGYNHESVKHKTNFIRQDDKRIYTQTIENRWGKIKQMIKKQGRISRLNIDIKLKEMVFRIQNHENISNKILEVIIINNFD